ncbi:MAG: DNA-binding response regulator [Bacteroidetes bacterium]|nr:MAG: DNA-binding response regulator [Bacteroidota bacterium]
MSLTHINLLVVDDHPMVIEGMKAMLQQIPFVVLQATAQNAFDALSVLEKNPHIDVAIVDINLPDTSGIELAAKMRKAFPQVRVLAMSTFKERSYIAQMIQNGAIGYLLKSASQAEIEQAILAAYEGKLHLSMDLQVNPRDVVAASTTPLLTSREKEVLLLIAEGLTSPQIAQKLFISLHTVDSHRKNLLTKFEVNNTAGLIKTAAKYQLV